MTASLFITGHRGFIGSALMRRCKALGIEASGIDLADGDDILTFDAGRVPEGAVIVHLAAISSNKACEADIHRTARVNIMGTWRILDIGSQRAAMQIIFASTEWVYDGLDGPYDEGRELDQAQLTTTYANSKFTAEKAVSRFPNSTILRFGIVYGPRQHMSDCALHNEPAYPAGPCNCGAGDSAVESILRDVQDGKAIKVGSLDTARRYIHIEDIVTGILACVGRTGCETFNLTGDALIPLLDVVQASANLTRVLQATIAEESDPANPSIRDAPNTKARQALNWKPEYDLERGLRSLMEVEP